MNIHFASTTFCWFPPDSLVTPSSTVGVLMRRLLRYSSETRVSCNSITSCLIVGGQNDSTVKWTGTLGPATSSGAGGVSYAADCVVGGTTCAAAWRSGVIGAWNGTTWVKSAPVAGLVLNDIACASDTKCIAVGNNARYYVWDGTSWARKVGFAYNA